MAFAVYIVCNSPFGKAFALHLCYYAAPAAIQTLYTNTSTISMPNFVNFTNSEPFLSGIFTPATEKNLSWTLETENWFTFTAFNDTIISNSERRIRLWVDKSASFGMLFVKAI